MILKPAKSQYFKWIIRLSVLLLLFEALFLIGFLWLGRQTRTERDGTSEAWGIHTEMNDSTSDRSKGPHAGTASPTGASPCAPGNLTIRHTYGNGRIYHVSGEAHLTSATGSTLWSREFDGFSTDLGAPVIAICLVDIDGDGRQELCFRQRFSTYADGDVKREASLRNRIGPTETVWLHGEPGSEPVTWLRVNIVSLIVGSRLRFALLSWLGTAGVLLVAAGPLCFVATVLSAASSRESKRQAA